jgi:pyrroline-5-carboxylate reductase
MVNSVAVIGTGVIGGAIAGCLLNSKHDIQVYATRRTLEKIKHLEEKGANITRNNRKAARESEVIFLCVKPNDVETVLDEIKKEIQGKLLISTAAIIPLKFFETKAPKARYVRTMPNIAAIVGESFTAYSMGLTSTMEDKETTEFLLGMMGKYMEVEEKYMDAITGLSGSGPAFMAIVIDALMYSGLRVGLPRDLSKLAAAQSVMGTARLILDGVLTPAIIEEMVTTPGGTTIEGIYEIEDGKLRTALMNAVQAATNKCIRIRDKWEKEN